MFYVSSKHGKDKYGVLDTSDGVEEIYSVKDLIDIINTYKVLIQGGIFI